MIKEVIHKTPEPLSKAFFKDYLMLSKFRLSVSVVGTTLIAYYLGTVKYGLIFDFMVLFGLCLGGMLVVAASNGFNQVIEKETDRLMDRTQNRPVAAGRMSVSDALIFSSVTAILGLFALAFYVNPTVAFLSLVSIFIYTLVYTPLKVKTPLAVFVGAIPGALPPAIGWIAVTGIIDEIAVILFLIQFFWQFPHFWAIAWILDDDYRKANYTLLPSFEGRTKKNALQIVLYTVWLILIAIYPLTRHFSSLNALFFQLPAGLYLLYRTIQLYKTLTIKDAKAVMFASLIYMPIVLISYLF
ncbi:MAG: heme o synthase [Bacteroidia bacterium]